MSSNSRFCFVAIVLTMTALLSGCGLFAARHTQELPFEDGARGKLIVLKAQDRVAYGKNFGVFCAEPSPDAISALATSVSASILLSAQQKADLATSLQQSVSGLGVRTQSIQLMRDALYRACEAFYSRALNKALYYDLHKRYQDHMIAVLAIEQLTGVVKSDQASVTGSSNALAASSTANIQDILAEAQTIAEQEQANLDALQENITANEAKLETLATEVTEQEATAAALTADITELEAAAAPPAAGTSETDQEKVDRLAAVRQLSIKKAELDASNTALNAKQGEQTELANALVADQTRLPAQQTIVDNAVQVQQSVEENLKASIRQGQAVASGSATVQSATHSSTISPLTVNSLAQTVQAIATSAINRPRTSDVCLDILKVAGGVSADQRDQSTRTDAGFQASNTALLDVCKQILTGNEGG